jgi:hypothetical protein
MLTNIERIRFKSAPARGPRIMIVWFVLMLLVALISAGVLLAGIVHAHHPQNAEGRFRPGEITTGTLMC